MYKMLLRVIVDQEITQEGWRFVTSEVLPSVGNGRLGTPSFDGEILCIQAMNPMDLEHVSEQLMSFGYRWSRDLRDADFAWFAFELPQLHWLEEVQAQPLKDELPTVDLWQLRGSRLRYFADHDGCVWWRGEDYEW
jgi:hypothetical protein